MLAGSILAITGITFCGINYIKFRSLNGVPVQYYVQYAINPAGAGNGGTANSLDELPDWCVAYFGLDRAELHREFPWIYMSAGVRVFP